MHEKDADSKRSRPAYGVLDRHLGRLGALATIAALAVMVYVGLTSRRSKALEVQYLAKLSLMTDQSTLSGKVSVTYGDKEVGALTKLLARIVNSGNSPILLEDIEKPVSLPFAPATVLEARTVSTSPPNLAAEVSCTSRAVQVSHGLLNPGDWVEFEVLCDGDFDWPEPTCRISGVGQPKMRILVAPEKEPIVAPVCLPRSMEYVVLVLASILAVAVLGVFVYFTWNQIVKALLPPGWGIAGSLSRALRVQPVARRAFDALPDALQDALEGTTLTERGKCELLLDEPDVIASHLEGVSLPPSGRAKDVAELANEIATEVRKVLPRVAARRAYLEFPLGLDRLVRDCIASTEFDPQEDGSVRDFIDRLRREATQELVRLGPWGRLKATVGTLGLIAVLGALLLVVSYGMVLAGRWGAMLI